MYYYYRESEKIKNDFTSVKFNLKGDDKRKDYEVKYFVVYDEDEKKYKDVYFTIPSVEYITNMEVNLNDHYAIHELWFDGSRIKLVDKRYFEFLVRISNFLSKENKNIILNEIDKIYKFYIGGNDNMKKKEKNNVEKNLEKKVEDIEKKINKILKKIKFSNNLIENKEEIDRPQQLYPITVIAKEYDLSGQALNTLLSILKVQYKVADTWVLYEKYSKKGLVKYQSILVGKNKHCLRPKKHMLWTNKGVEFIDELLRKHKIINDKEVDLFVEEEND